MSRYREDVADETLRYIEDAAREKAHADRMRHGELPTPEPPKPPRDESVDDDLSASYWADLTGKPWVAPTRLLDPARFVGRNSPIPLRC